MRVLYIHNRNTNTTTVSSDILCKFLDCNDSDNRRKWI